MSQVVQKNIYVDDCLSGTNSHKNLLKLTDELELVINKGGFTLKGITVSGSDPPQHLSNDGESISVAGLNWFPKSDHIALDIKDLNFAKKSRGRKTAVIADVPINLTRRQCVSKVEELFDIPYRTKLSRTKVTKFWRGD